MKVQRPQPPKARLLLPGLLVAAAALVALLAVAGPAQAVSTGGPDLSLQKYRWKDSTFGSCPSGAECPIGTWTPIGYCCSFVVSPGLGSQVPGTSVTTTSVYGGPLTIPFPFTFYGSSYTSVYVGIDGYLSFSGGSETSVSSAIPSAAAPNNQLAAYHTDMNGMGSCTANSYLSYYNQGSTPNRQLIIEWNLLVAGQSGACAALTYNTLQVRLYETTNNIDAFIHVGGPPSQQVNSALNCAPPPLPACYAEIGVEDSTGAYGLQYLRDTTTGAPNIADRGIRFYPNHLPVVAPATVTLNEDCSAATSTTGCAIPVALPPLTGSDALDGDTVTFCIASNPAYGTLTTAPAACGATSASPNVSYQPNADFCGTDSFTYEAYDGLGYSAATTITLTVTCIADAPIATADSYTLFEDCSATSLASCSLAAPPYFAVPVTCGVPAGLKCNDIERDDLQVPTPSPTHKASEAIVITAGPASGQIYKNDGTGAGTVSTDGSFRYIPNDNFCGSDSFSYKLQDDNVPTGLPVPTFSNTVTVALTVTCILDIPVGVADVYTVTAGTVTSFPGILPTYPPYPPAASSCPSGPPPAGILCNDYDYDSAAATLTAVSYSAVSCGGITTPANGGFTFTAPASGPATCTFTYKVQDGTGLQSPAVTVTINVLPNGPAATPDLYALNEDCSPTTATSCASPFVANPKVPSGSCLPTDGVLCNDPNPLAHVMKAILVTPPSKGVLGGTGIVASPGGDGSFTYTPNPNYCNGPPYTTPDSFTYRIYDFTTSTPGSSVTVSLNVLCVADAPVAVADAYTVNEDCQVAPAVSCGALSFQVGPGCALPPLGLRCNDNDPDDLQVPTPSPTHVTLETAVLLSGPASGTIVKFDGTGVSPVITSDGSFRYVPNANFCGTDSFTYKLKDDGSPAPTTADSAVVTVTMTITCRPDNPVAVADGYLVAANKAMDTLGLGRPPTVANDADPDLPYGDTLQALTPIMAPCSGVGTGTLSFFSSGHFIYTPPNGFVGTTSFSYKATSLPDGLPSAACATVTLNVQVNKPPIASFSASALTVQVGQLVAFVDTSKDPDLGGMVVAWNWDLGDGAVAKSKAVTHAYGAVGQYNACVSAGDEFGDYSAPACQAVSVVAAAGPSPPPGPSPPAGPDSGPAKPSTTGATPPAPPPPAVAAGADQTVPAKALVTLAGTVSGNAPACVWQQLQGPPVALSGAGACQATFTAPAAGKQPVVLVFALIGSDGELAGTPDTVTIVVHSDDQAPHAGVAAESHATPGASVTLDGSGSTDADGDQLTYAWTQRNGPTVAISSPAAAKPTFTVPAGASGTLSFALEVSDGLASDVAVQTIVVDPSPTVGASFARTVAPDGTVSVTPLVAGSAFAWDFGDGSTTTTDGGAAHTYDASGTYTILLRVDEGAAVSQDVAVSVPQPHGAAAASADPAPSAGVPWLLIGLGAAAVALAGAVVVVLLKKR